MMKALVKIFLLSLVLIGVLMSCGSKKNAVDSGGTPGGSLPPSTNPYQTVSSNHREIVFNYASTSGFFHRGYSKDLNGNVIIYTAVNNYQNDSQVLQFLESLSGGATQTRFCVPQESFVTGNNLTGPYRTIFGREYDLNQCVVYLINNNEAYYVDTNFPIVANPIAYFKVESGKWWIFTTSTTKYYSLYDLYAWSY